MCSHSHEHHCCGHTHAQNHILHGKNNILSIYKAEILSALLLVVTLIIEHCGVLRRISSRRMRRVDSGDNPLTPSHSFPWVCLYYENLGRCGGKDAS